jgi:ketosteroid isomerase-like protein
MTMAYLSEDPTFLAGGLLLLAGVFAVALRVTQQGKYLIRAMVAVGLAAAVVVIEWLWVTDNERIEQVVYDLRRAVLDSDAETALAHMTPDVEFSRRDMAMFGEATRELVRRNLSQTRFEFLRISNMETSAGRQSRRGKAEFRVFAKGSLHTPQTTMNIGTANSVWSLGFRETEPGVWKVSRITPVQIPNDALTIPGRGAAPDRSRLGYNAGTDLSRPLDRGGLGRRRVDPRVRDPANPSGSQ